MAESASLTLRQQRKLAILDVETIGWQQTAQENAEEDLWKER
jgi:hypothetical protein